MIDDAEINYLCDAVNRHFIKQITAACVRSTWSGVRPLYDDGASEAKAVTRDYVLEMDSNGPVLLSIFGGKITTARHLAEEAVAKLARPMGFAARAATRGRAFPGGDIASFDQFLADVRARWPFLGERRSYRMTRAYGTMLHEMLRSISSETELGKDLGGGLTEAEARWMYEREWARSADDALDRRSKIGLRLDAQQRAAFTSWWNATFSA